MIGALKEFDDTYNYEYYEAISWGGLQGTVAYNALSQTKKEQLKTNIQKFKKDAKKTECQ